MKSFIKLIPFIFLILYFSLVRDLDLSWSTKFLILLSMILVSVFSFLKSTERMGQKKLVYLFLGILSVCVVAIEFYI